MEEEENQMKYKELVTEQMNWLQKQPKTVFIGEGMINADRIYETLNNVPSTQCIEMPIAENLIMGTAIGLALKGWRPIVVFQRMDFMLCAADQIINHLALIDKMSNGQYKCPVIIRCIIGSRKEKFWVGEQHNHDFTSVFSPFIQTVRFGYWTDTYIEAY